jgi:hypothetical protein
VADIHSNAFLNMVHNMFSSTALSLNNSEWISLLGVIVPFMPHGVSAKIHHYDDRTGRGVVSTLTTDAGIARKVDLDVSRVLGGNCPGKLATPICACETCERRREVMRTHPFIVKRARIADAPGVREINGIARVDGMSDLRHLLDAS